MIATSELELLRAALRPFTEDPSPVIVGDHVAVTVTREQFYAAQLAVLRTEEK